MFLKFITYTIFLLSFSLVFSYNASAKTVDESCKQVEVVFARGSGGILDQGESNVFFEQITKRVKSEKINVLTYELGKEEYGGHKYQAIQVHQAPWGNAIGAKTSSGYANDYGKSVDSGVGELFTYLAQRYQKCKSSNTKFVLGGYSQGAQVIGQTLPKFSTELKNSIVYVALFGDPKLHLPEGQGINPPACQGKNLSLYRRVIANCNVDNGSLGARTPYLPDDIKKKAGLWCYDHDYICGVTHNVFDNDGHGKYKDSDMAIDQAAIEIAKNLKSQLPSSIANAIDTKQYGSASGKPDVVYVIDTTGSMEDRIDQTKEFVRSASAKIQEMNGRVALVAYKDLGDEYTAKVMSDFSGDLTEFRSKLDQLNANGGGDTPEATLHALTTAFNNLSWRNGATKAAVVLTDAGYHVPDRVDGSTIATVAKRALEIDPVNVYPVVPQHLEAEYTPLAEQTSGQVIIDNGNTTEALTEALTKIKKRPVAILKNTEYRANPGQDITFDASDSYVVDAVITKYEWDFEGDGIFDKETKNPAVNYMYNNKFEGTMQVRLTSSNGTIANASAVIKIGTYVEPLRPKTPKNIATRIVNTKNGVSTIKLSWKPSDALAEKWIITINGVSLGYVTKAQNDLEISDIKRDDDVEVGVAGAMNDGTVGETGTVIISKDGVGTSSQLSWWQLVLDFIRRLFQPITFTFSLTWW